MHELSIILSLLDEIDDQTSARGLEKVEIVHLKVGAFSGVDPEALLFAWGMACEGTPFAQAKLAIETVPLVVFCDVCGQQGAPPSLSQICCPACGTPSATIVTGRELELVALETGP